MGQQAYAANLAIISQAVLRTVYTRIIQVLVEQRNMLAVFAQRAHHNNLIQAREVSKLAVHSFGALQKNTFGMDMVIGQIENMFRAKMLAQPDAIILPQGCLQYLKTCKPEERVFALCGEMARRLEIEPTRSLTTNVYKNNYQIFEHKPMTVSDDVGTVNMLQREREVGNVFRIFRNPAEQHGDAAKLPTAIKVIDHDKQRWAMLTLGDVLAKTEIWNPNVTIRVDQSEGQYTGNFMARRGEMRHLKNFGRNSPLYNCQVIGDLGTDKLKLSTIREAVHSIEEALKTNKSDQYLQLDGKLDEEYLKALCSNNVWFNGSFEYIGSNVDSTENVGASAATASVEEVGEALQSAMLEAVLADDPSPEVTERVNSEAIKSAIADVVSITNDMTDTQRGSIASALVGAVSGFKNSKSALRKVIRNKDPSKQQDLDAAYGEAVRKDLGTNWKNINTEAKKIAAKIGPSTTGENRGDERFFERNFQEHLKNIDNAGFSSIQRRLARWYIGCSIDLPTIVSLDSKGIVTPFGALVFRPMQQFTMGSAVVMRSGIETGFTAVGNSDFILGSYLILVLRQHLSHFLFCSG